MNLLTALDSCPAEIDLMLFSRGGSMEENLPPSVNMLPVPAFFRFQEKSFYRRMTAFDWHDLWCGIKLSVRLRLREGALRKRHPEQIIYSCIEPALEKCPSKYDVAVSYGQGVPTYFVADKIDADRKVAWINCDYGKTRYNKRYDKKFYKQFDSIVLVSEHAYSVAKRIFPSLRKKLNLIYDILSPSAIYKMADGESPFSDGFTGSRILTVGRLVSAKGYSLAIETCRLLIDKGLPIRWYVIGEGIGRAKLEMAIRKYKLEKVFILLGEKQNPYPWMRYCDLYVQTSLQEGLGLTVIEARILGGPIVCTDFETAHEILKGKVDSYITSKSSTALLKAIEDALGTLGPIESGSTWDHSHTAPCSMMKDSLECVRKLLDLV